MWVLTSGSTVMRPITYPSWFGTSSNVFLAILVLLAIRLGRWSSEQKQLRRFGTQGHPSLDDLVGTNRDLAMRRKAFENKRVAMIKQETKKRLEDAEKRAKQEAAEKREREERYKKEQEEEIKRLQVLRQKQREEFEEQEQIMQSELEKRMEIEKQLQAEMEAKRKKEAERQQQMEAERRRQKEEERVALAAEQRKQMEEDKKRKLEEKQKLNALKTKFAVRFEGDVHVKRSASGIRTAGPLAQDALCTISVAMKTSFAEERVEMEDHFASKEDVLDSAGKLLGFVCRGAADQYSSNAQLQVLTGSGPLSAMDDIDLALFMRYASLMAHDEMETKLQLLLSEWESDPVMKARDSTIQVRQEWGILPEGHEKRLDSIVATYLQRLAQNDATFDELEQSIDAWIEEERENLDKGYKEATYACFLAYFFDRSLKMGDSAVYDAAVKILHALLDDACMTAPLDSLQSQSLALNSALGTEHPVAVWFEEFARQNLGPKKRAEAAEKKSCLDAALKAQVLEQQWPDRAQITAELLKEREESTPVPEQVWALRNVARTLVMSALPSESALNQSIDLMKKALRLQQKFLGSATHPGMLGPLRDYAKILDRVDPEMSAVIWEQIFEILEELSDRYRKQGDLFSAALCAETAVVQGEKALDIKNPVITKLSKKSEALLDVLKANEKTRFLEIRRSKSGMDVIVDAFTAQLGVYKTPGKLDRIEAWTEDKPLDPI